MKKITILIFSLLSILANAQKKIQLRDVNFEISPNFLHIVKENSKIEYDAYYENGKIYTDSSDVSKYPQIYYQYYENPGQGSERSEIVLKRLNEIMSKDFKADTTIINSHENYSVAKYQIMGNTLFEIKSLGEKGWLNLQYIDSPNNDLISFKDVQAIAKKIKHNGKYGSEYSELMQESGRSSKFAIVAFIFFLFVFLMRKLMNKNSA